MSSNGHGNGSETIPLGDRNGSNRLKGDAGLPEGEQLLKSFSASSEGIRAEIRATQGKHTEFHTARLIRPGGDVLEVPIAVLPDIKSVSERAFKAAVGNQVALARVEAAAGDAAGGDVKLKNVLVRGLSDAWGYIVDKDADPWRKGFLASEFTFAGLSMWASIQGLQIVPGNPGYNVVLAGGFSLLGLAGFNVAMANMKRAETVPGKLGHGVSMVPVLGLSLAMTYTGTISYLNRAQMDVDGSRAASAEVRLWEEERDRLVEKMETQRGILERPVDGSAVERLEEERAQLAAALGDPVDGFEYESFSFEPFRAPDRAALDALEAQYQEQLAALRAEGATGLKSGYANKKGVLDDLKAEVARMRESYGVQLSQAQAEYDERRGQAQQQFTRERTEAKSAYEARVREARKEALQLLVEQLEAAQISQEQAQEALMSGPAAEKLAELEAELEKHAGLKAQLQREVLAVADDRGQLTKLAEKWNVPLNRLLMGLAAAIELSPYLAGLGVYMARGRGREKKAGVQGPALAMPAAQGEGAQLLQGEPGQVSAITANIPWARGQIEVRLFEGEESATLVRKWRQGGAEQREEMVLAIAELPELARQAQASWEWSNDQPTF